VILLLSSRDINIALVLRKKRSRRKAVLRKGLQRLQRLQPAVQQLHFSKSSSIFQ